MAIDLENEEFQNVWKLIKFTRQSVFMTGKAGAGKSTFLKYITENTRKRHIVLAPTGIAAVNVGGVTLHSFFKLPFKPLVPDDPDFAGDRLRKRLAYNKAKVKLIKEVELIVIDEVSMVRADIIDFIDRILRTYSGNTRQPFGGKQMLFVGDIFQLEPVVTADMREVLRRFYPNPYFFSANVFRDFAVVPIELRKIYRQQDTRFLSLLDRVRSGRPTREDVLALNSRYAQIADTPNDEFVMTLATRRDTVEQINMRHLSGLQSPEVSYRGMIRDDFPESSLPVPVELSLKVGAQVVFVKNDREKRWVNGTIGRVTATNAKEIEVELESGERYQVQPEVWENIIYKYDEETKRINEEVVGTYTQLPVNLAWALTIHKSQGLTFNRVIIDASGAFTGGQTYVALSRCRSLEGITLKNQINERDVFVNQAVVNFSRGFNAPELIDRALSVARADSAFEEAAKAFDSHLYGASVEKFVEGMSLRNEMSRPSVARLLKMKLLRLTKAEAEIACLTEKLSEAETKFSKLADEYVSMGRDCAENSFDPTAAMANFNKAISLVPDHQRAWLGKADVMLQFGEAEEALEAVSKCGDLTALPIHEVVKVGMSLLRQGHEYEALDLMLRIYEANKKNVSVLDSLADIYDSIGDEDSASHYRSIARKIRKKH